MSVFSNFSVQILVLLFFSITYILAIIEKVADWKGTIDYYNNHFKNTKLQKIIPLLLLIVVFFEIVIVFLLAIGLYFLVSEESFIIAKVGLEISAILLLLFLIGQRLAKDYAGAMNITVYFILTVIGIYILT